MDFTQKMHIQFSYESENNSVNQLICVMIKCDVFFAVRTEFVSTVRSFGFRGLTALYRLQRPQSVECCDRMNAFVEIVNVFFP
jgi:hypothetical protein